MHQLHANAAELYKEKPELLQVRKYSFIEQREQEIRDIVGTQEINRENKMILVEAEKMFDTLFSYGFLPDEADWLKLYQKLQICKSPEK